MTNWVVTPRGWIKAAPTSNDDLNLAYCGGNNNGFSMTYNRGRYSVPSDLTWFGLDMTLNPVYGWDALATPASGFLGP
jgi:hypothetical protein